jgi:hypothetical protein
VTGQEFRTRLPDFATGQEFGTVFWYEASFFLNNNVNNVLLLNS